MHGAGSVDVLLTHEAPKPFWIDLPVLDLALQEVAARRRQDAHRGSWRMRCQPRLHCFGHHHVHASFDRAGIPTVCVDRINRGYLLVDADDVRVGSARDGSA